MFDSYSSRHKNIKRIIFWTVLIAALLAFFIPNLVRALAITDLTADPCLEFKTCVTGLGAKPTNSKGEEATTGEFASRIILQLAGILAYICGSLAVLFIVKGAWDMMSSGGDSAKYQKALMSMGYAIAGLFAVAASWGIVASVLSFLNTVQIG